VKLNRKNPRNFWGVSPVWICYADMFGALASLFMVMAAPKEPPHPGVDMKAEFLISVSWDVEHYDADLDLWTTTPDGTPVFFGKRQVGCAGLDQDNRGWVDSVVRNKDGSIAKFDQAKETVAIRCRQTGHYNFGVNFYSYVDHAGKWDHETPLGIKAHVEVAGLNPVYKTLWQGDVTMNLPNEVVNAVSFDLMPDGTLKFKDVPLEPVTDSRSKLNGDL
jgi:hypothetical protein